MTALRMVEAGILTAAFLVIEVAQTSQRRDHEKAADYAAAVVPEYWIVDVDAHRVVVHRHPGPDGYGTSREYGPDEEVVPSVDAPPVRVSELLGV